MRVRAITLGGGDHRRFAGVAVGPRRHFACVVDLESSQLVLAQAPLEARECVAWLTAHAPAVVAIGAPPGPNNGAVARRCGERAERRLAERRLGLCGAFATPGSEQEMVQARSWMAAGIQLFRMLGDAWGVSADFGGGDGRLIETQPSLAFRSLLGHEGDPEEQLRLDPAGLLGAKHTRRGKRGRIALLQRALGELSIDPRRGIDAWARRVDWAEATISALVACWRVALADDVVQVGDGSEGVITLRQADWSSTLLALPAEGMGPPIDRGPWARTSHRDSAPPPSRRGRAPHPGWLLRFEVQKGPTPSAQELRDTLAGEIAVDQETWMPLRIKGQALSGVANAVESGHCEMATSFDGRVNAIVDVLEIQSNTADEIAWHPLTGHETNPWYVGDQCIDRSGVWLRVAKLRDVDLGPEQFDTGRKDGGWGQGFPASAAPLVRWRERLG